MESLNLPTSVDWFSGLIVPIAITIIAGIIVKIAEGKVNSSKGLGFIVGVLVCVAIFVLLWYNLIGAVYFLRGQSVEATKGCQGAVPLYEKAVSWNPKLIGARHQLVYCMIVLNRASDLVPILEPLDALLFDSPHYWQDLALTYYAIGDYDEMAHSVGRSADLDPENSDWITTLGERLHRETKYGEAETVLRIVRTHNDDDGLAVFWLAWALYEQNKYSDALYHFEECIVRFDAGHTLGRCHAGKGFALLKLKRYDDARLAFQQALEIEPNQDDVRTALSQLP